MLRTLIIAGLLWSMTSVSHAAEPVWQTCQGINGPQRPILSGCRPLAGVIDPQGQELWLRSSVPAPVDDRLQALHLFGIASSEAWLNGRRLGANGRPGATAQSETAGRYQAALPIAESVWRPGPNELVVHLSSFHSGLRLDYPMGAVVVAPYPLPSRLPMLAATFVAAGALIAAAFGFGVIHALRRTGSSLSLSALAGVAAAQAVVENLRALWAYPYPLHVWRLGLIWMLAATFAVLLVAYTARRFMARRRETMVGLAVVAAAATALLPGFDFKTGAALITGLGLALGASAAGVWRRQAGARLTLAYLTLFLGLALAFPRWLVDLSFFLLAAGLVLPLLAVEVVRLGQEDRGREAALTRAAGQPNRLTVASTRGVELVPIPEIVAVVGADDYVELRLAGGRTLLHTARLDRLEGQLPVGFLRIHRSVIANLTQVRRLEPDGGRWRVQMAEGPPLPVSRSRLPGLRDALDDAALSNVAG